MGKRASNFSERALKESKARDKQLRYNAEGRKFSELDNIDYESLSTPVMSGVLPDNKILVRRYGYTADPAGYYWDTNTGEKSPWYAKVGVQSILLRDPETGTLRESDEVPQVIRFHRPPIDGSFGPGKRGRVSKKVMKEYMKAWAEMIKDKTENFPDITSMPLLSEKQINEKLAKEAQDRLLAGYPDEDLDEEFRDYDEAHSDIGTILTKGDLDREYLLKSQAEQRQREEEIERNEAEFLAKEKREKELADKFKAVGYKPDSTKIVGDSSKPKAFIHKKGNLPSVLEYSESNDDDDDYYSPISEQAHFKKSEKSEKSEQPKKATVIIHKKHKPTDNDTVKKDSDAKADAIAKLEAEIAALKKELSDERYKDVDCEVSDMRMKNIAKYNDTCIKACLSDMKMKDIIKGIGRYE